MWILKIIKIIVDISFLFVIMDDRNKKEHC